MLNIVLSLLHLTGFSFSLRARVAQWIR